MTMPTMNMSTITATLNEAAPKKPRKKVARTKGLRTVPAAAARLKELWATPEFRAKMQKRDQDRIAASKLDPAKYRRQGVPNGMRRADAEPMWAKARLLADRFIEILKEKGELTSREPCERPESPVSGADATVDPVDLKQPPGSDHERDLVPGMIPGQLVEVPKTDEGKAEAALRQAFLLAMGPVNVQVRQQAINLVLQYTMARPEAQTALKLGRAEDYLTSLSEPESDTDEA
jgi:hypothetical protein